MMPFTVSTEDAQKTFPDYTIVAPLTPSAFKAAFHAKDASKRDLCVKIISPEFSSDRLEREIKAMTQLDHNNVVRLIEYSFTTSAESSRHYVIEEFVHGTDLSDALGKPWPHERIQNVFTGILSGLDHVKSLDLVHRDLKPSNVRLTPDDRPVIIDFGLVRHLELPDLTATNAGARIGTPKYFAPEQFRGTKRDIDHRTDLFAFGTILYQAALGFHPFDPTNENPDLATLEARICEERTHLEIDEFESLHPTLQLLITKLLSRDRADRPSEARHAIQMLNKIGGGK